MPSRNHALIQSELVYVLKQHYRSEFTFLSEVELGFLPKGAVPDIAIYPKMHVDFDDDLTKMTEPPLTAIEILSPPQALEDLTGKAKKIYFPNGVKSVWVVMMPLKSIAVVTPGQPAKFFSEGELHDPVTNIRLKIDEVFQA